MSTSPDLTRPIPQDLLDQEHALLPGQLADFVVDGRAVRLQRTDAGLVVVSVDRHAVVIRPQSDTEYIVTGAAETHHPSRPVDFEGALRIALERLG
jgi:hypothetical protein